METKQYIERYFEDAKSIIDAFDMNKIVQVVDVLYQAWEKGNRVYVIGNGGSASTASHFACDLAKWASGDGAKRIKAFSLVDNIPLMSALTNDDGWDNVYLEQLKTNLEKGDIVVAFSVHGGKGKEKAGAWSQNLSKALDYANKNGGISIGFSGFDGGAFNELTKINVVVPFESTPHVEAFHSMLAHLIADAIRKRTVGTGGKK